MSSAAPRAAVDADVQKAIRMAIAATEKKDYKTALTLFNHVYGNPALDAPTEGLSYYGLCVAVAEKQTKKGIDLCRAAIKEQFYESSHHENLVRLHLAKGNRKLAVQALEEASKALPKDARIERLRLEIGYRQNSVVPFLPRQNAINTWIGKRRRGRGNTSSKPTTGRVAALSVSNLQPLQMMLFGVFTFAAIFGVTFFILYQRAYG